MTLNDRLRAVVEEYLQGVPLARNYALTFQLILTNENTELVGSVVADTITGKVGYQRPPIKPMRRVVLTNRKIVSIEKDIKHRRFMAGPEQPVEKPRPNQFMYRERERE